jgi:hypothetical protein
MDANLTPQERELAEVTEIVAEAVDKSAPDGYWAEDLIPPMEKDDVLSSMLYTSQGSPEPKAGFTLWAPDGQTAYRVIIERFPAEGNCYSGIS